MFSNFQPPFIQNLACFNLGALKFPSRPRPIQLKPITLIPVPNRRAAPNSGGATRTPALTPRKRLGSPSIRRRGAPVRDFKWVPYRPRSLVRDLRRLPSLHRQRARFAPPPRSPPPPPRPETPLPEDLTFENLHKTITKNAPNPETLSAEDRIFLDQMAAMNLNRVFKAFLEKDRDAMIRGQKDAPLLKRRRAMKIKEALQRQAEDEANAEALRRQHRHRREAKKREARVLAQMKESNEMAAREAARLKRVKEAEEARIAQAKAEAEAALKASQMKAFQEAAREAARLAGERAEAEAAAFLAAQRRAEEEEAARLVAQAQAEEEARQAAYLLYLEQERQREMERVAYEQAVLALFATYDAKWEALKGEVPPLHCHQLPWPVITDTITPDWITLPNLTNFVYHPARLVGKSKRERVKAELLKWHPDKFNAKVLNKMVEEERDVTQELAGRVARILNEMMTNIEE